MIDFYKHFEYRSIQKDAIDAFDADNVLLVKEAIKDLEYDLLPKYYTKLYLLPTDLQKDFVKNEIEKTIVTISNIHYLFNEVLMTAFTNGEDEYATEDIVFSWLDILELKEYRKYYEDGTDILVQRKWDAVTLPKFKDVVKSIAYLDYFSMLKWHLALLKKGKRVSVKNPKTHIDHSLNEEQLAYLYKQLTQKILLIDDIRTTYEDFLSVFNEDFSKNDSEIIWDAKTKQVSYFLSVLKKDAGYTYASIENSGKFISCEGNPLKASNISKGVSSTKDFEARQKKEIDKIIKDMPREKQ